MSSSFVPRVVEHARESEGGSAVAAILEWEEPPDAIKLHTGSHEAITEGGEPGPEVREITEIVDWFNERGMYLMFAARGTGTGPIPAVPHYSVHTAHVIDPKADTLLGSFEAPSRLEAARKARDAMRDIAAPHATSQATAPPPTVNIDTAEVERLTRSGKTLIWNYPSEGDPKSGWLLEAYDDENRLIDFAVADDPADALLTVIENLLPPKDPD